MSLQGYYNEFSFLVTSGQFCEGEGCRGWFCSNVDTWHRCGCGRGPEKSPEEQSCDAEAEIQASEVKATPVVEEKQFVIESSLGNHERWAFGLASSFKIATKVASDFAKANKKSATVRRVRGADLVNAIAQINRVEEWESDFGTDYDESYAF